MGSRFCYYLLFLFFCISLFSYRSLAFSPNFSLLTFPPLAYFSVSSVTHPLLPCNMVSCFFYFYSFFIFLSISRSLPKFHRTFSPLSPISPFPPSLISSLLPCTRFRGITRVNGYFFDARPKKFMRWFYLASRYQEFPWSRACAPLALRAPTTALCVRLAALADRTSPSFLPFLYIRCNAPALAARKRIRERVFVDGTVNSLARRRVVNDSAASNISPPRSFLLVSNL